MPAGKPMTAEEAGVLSLAVAAMLPHWARGPLPVAGLFAERRESTTWFASDLTGDTRSGWSWTTHEGHWMLAIGAPGNPSEYALAVQGPGGYWLFTGEHALTNCGTFLLSTGAVPHTDSWERYLRALRGAGCCCPSDECEREYVEQARRDLEDRAVPDAG